MHALGIVFDDRYRRHVTGPGHPERPERLAAVARALEAAKPEVDWTSIEPRPIDEALTLALHTRDYLTRLETACREGWSHVDVPDCPICADSCEIARLAAGGVVEAARRIASGDIKRAFCAVRPPGHHAEADHAMGFCLLNNVALAAMALRREFGIERTLILDWDVHHGNGTQHLFEDDPAVLYISLHGHPTYLFPGTGFETETGTGAGRGYTINIPLMPGTTDAAFQAAFESTVVPAVERYAPQAVLVSAGFDAHADDPLGNLRLSDATFAWVTQRTLELAGHLTDGRVLSVLEGGYNLGVLERCVAEHVRLLGQ